MSTAAVAASSRAEELIVEITVVFKKSVPANTVYSYVKEWCARRDDHVTIGSGELVAHVQLDAADIVISVSRALTFKVCEWPAFIAQKLVIVRDQGHKRDAGWTSPQIAIELSQISSFTTSINYNWENPDQS